MNTFGTLFQLTTFGESHGGYIGGVLDGYPANITIDTVFLRAEMSRRRAGKQTYTTSREEQDEVEILSGVFEGKSTGTPLAFIIKNTDVKSSDYDENKDVYRPSHADFTYQQKYGIRDYRGGGRASARETAVRVAAGAFAKMALHAKGIHIMAYTSQIGNIILEKKHTEYDLTQCQKSPLCCPDKEKSRSMEVYLRQIHHDKDSIGGCVTGIIQGCPIGLGEPLYNKLQADLAAAMLSINAVKGFDYGLGFNGIPYTGKEQNDLFYSKDDGSIGFQTNRSGGIQGGISNGEDIYFRVAFKPVATIMQEQQSVTIDGQATTIKGKGRHDVCVVPRAVPVVEAMAAITILDHYLQFQARQNFNNNHI